MQMLAEDVPPAEFFDLLRKDLGKRSPTADLGVIEHVVSLEETFGGRVPLGCRTKLPRYSSHKGW